MMCSDNKIWRSTNGHLHSQRIQLAKTKHSTMHNEHMALLSQRVSEAENRAGLGRGSRLGIAGREGNEDAMIAGTGVRSIRIKYCMTGT